MKSALISKILKCVVSFLVISALSTHSLFAANVLTKACRLGLVVVGKYSDKLWVLPHSIQDELVRSEKEWIKNGTLSGSSIYINDRSFQGLVVYARELRPGSVGDPIVGEVLDQGAAFIKIKQKSSDIVTLKRPEGGQLQVSLYPAHEIEPNHTTRWTRAFKHSPELVGQVVMMPIPGGEMEVTLTVVHSPDINHWVVKFLTQDGKPGKIECDSKTFLSIAPSTKSFQILKDAETSAPSFLAQFVSAELVEVVRSESDDRVKHEVRKSISGTVIAQTKNSLSLRAPTGEITILDLGTLPNNAWRAHLTELSGWEPLTPPYILIRPSGYWTAFRKNGSQF